MQASGTTLDPKISERRSLHADAQSYCAHPHLAVAPDGLWHLVFNVAPRRALILHPPQDPDYRNVAMHSRDEGRSWSPPVTVPDEGWTGVECAGLTALRDGRILLNQWQFDWLPPSAGGTAAGPAALVAGLLASSELDMPGRHAPDAMQIIRWSRGGGRTAVHRSDDGGRTFASTSLVDTAPFSGGYGMRGALELAGGDILLPLSDVPNYRQVFVIRSRDGGTTWSPPVLVASGDGHEFEEPAGIVLPSGRIVLMLRDNLTRLMHVVTSSDDGATWSPPRATGLTAYPGHLLALRDGRFACIAGRREPPFAIVLHLSEDGEGFDPDPCVLVDDLPSKDLGYPTAALRTDGNLVVVYYAQDRDGLTGIHTLTARLP